MLQAGELIQGRYGIIKIVGRGGMSTVYQVRDRETGRLLAIKDMARSGKDQDSTVEQSLNSEGRILKQLSNPHLPQIYDVIEREDSILLVMDFIEGESLDKIIAREGPQSMERVLDWGMQICDVFQYLHNQPTPIIYRDMKPANVMLQPDGKLMMIDFGTARTQKVGVAMTADTTCIGTVGFAAPEQFGGQGQSTARTDIFCLGGTLYNLITGHSPSDRPTGILPLETWNPELAGTPLAEIIYKCTRNDPNERYQSAAELREDLVRAANGTYRSGKKGLSGSLWQKQDVHGMGMIAGGLSELLQRGRTGQTSQMKKPEAVSGGIKTETGITGSNWQRQELTPIQPPQQPVTPPEGEESLLRKLTLMAALIAVIFVVFTVVLALMRATGVAIVFLVIALLAAGCAVACMLISQKQS